ncbi:RNA pseudouridine synthase [Wandonia haliotis]|uniref:RNA pseudouridine synthase n=1 Tax=Wandonia haliotis TaxID=574963 RepID=A0ABN1MSY5_9FLAO
MEVLYEDNHLIIVNKEAGEIVQGDKTGDVPLSDKVKEYIRLKYDKPGAVFLGVVHRLDRPVSGIVLFARTSKALERMNKKFREKDVSKKYWAIVENTPDKESATLENYLKKNPEKNKSFVQKDDKQGAKLSKLSYKVVDRSDRYTLLEVELHTGRHHQIRVQLSTMGCVIKGDLKYGAKRSNEDASIHLHARELSFVHPVSKENIKVIAPVPQHDTLWKFFEQRVK